MIRFFLVISGLLLLFFASVQIGNGNVPSFLLNKQSKTDQKQTDTNTDQEEKNITQKQDQVPEEKTAPVIVQPENLTTSAPAKAEAKDPVPYTQPHITIVPEAVKPEPVQPPPLQNIKPASRIGTLDASAVLTLTNKERQKQGLPVLTHNTKLDSSALMKAMDMLEKQYFAHDSPTGVTVEDLANAVKYEFVSLGENLAYGNFESNAELVQGWMDSPGHRANILSSKYTEIGVAVVKGTYEGKEVWMAVQEFGKPRSSCPQPDSALKEKIDAANADLDRIGFDITAMKEKLQQTDPQSDPTYSTQVDDVNSLVSLYNTQIATIKMWIAEYNAQIQAFNQCAKS